MKNAKLKYPNLKQNLILAISTVKSIMEKINAKWLLIIFFNIQTTKQLEGGRLK